MDDILRFIRDQGRGVTDAAEMERICSNPNSIQLCQRIIEQPVTDAVFGAIATMRLITGRFAKRLESSTIESILEWSVEIVEREPERWLWQRELMDALGGMAATIVVKYYKNCATDEFIRNVFRLVTHGELPVARVGLCFSGCIVHGFVHDSEGKSQTKDDFFDDKLPICLSEAIGILGKMYGGKFGHMDGEYDAIRSALLILERGLSVKQRSRVKHCRGDEIDQFTVNIPAQSSQSFGDPMLMELMKSLYVGFDSYIRSACLEVVFRVMSISNECIFHRSDGALNAKKLNVSRRYLSYVDFMINVLRDASTMENLHKVCIMAYKLNIALVLVVIDDIDSPDAIGEIQCFCGLMKDLTNVVLSPQHMVESPQTLMYLVKFWGCFARKHDRKEVTNTFFSGVREVLGTLVHKLYNVISDAFMISTDDMFLFFDLDDYGTFIDFEVFSSLAWFDFVNITGNFVGLLRSETEKYGEGGDCELKLSLLVDIASWLLRHREDKKDAETLNAKRAVSESVMGLAKLTHMMLERQGPTQEAYLEKKLLAFFSLCGTRWDDFHVPMREVFCRAFIGLVYYQDNLSVVTLSLKSVISKYLVCFVGRKLNDRALVDFIVEGRSKLSRLDRESMKNFLQICYKFFFSCEQSVVNKQLENLGRHFSAQMAKSVESGFVALMDDMGALFSAADRASYYMPIVPWFTGSRMNELRDRFHVIAERPVIYFAFLQMWYSFINNTNNRMKIDDFSSEGIVIFKVTGSIIDAFFKMTGERKASEFDPISEIYELVLRIVETAMSANYVSFDVFRVYGDSTCERMIHRVFSSFEVFSLATIVQYPDVTRRIIHTLETLVKARFDNLVRAGHVGTTVHVVSRLVFLDNCDLEADSLRVLSLLLDATARAKIPLVVDVDAIGTLTKRLFECVFNDSIEPNDVLISVIRGLLHLNFDTLGYVARTVIATVDDGDGKVENMFSSITIEMVAPSVPKCLSYAFNNTIRELHRRFRSFPLIELM